MRPSLRNTACMLMWLSSGVYLFESSAQRTGNLFLNFPGNSNARFVFQIGSTLTIGARSAVEARSRSMAR